MSSLDMNPQNPKHEILKEQSLILPEDVVFDSRYSNVYKFFSPSTKQFYTILDMEKDF